MTQEEIRMSEPARARSTGSVGAHISASAPGHGARGLQRVRECLGVLASGGQSSDRLDGLSHQVDAAKWRAGEEKGSVPAIGGMNGRVAVLRGVSVIALRWLADRAASSVSSGCGQLWRRWTLLQVSNQRRKNGLGWPVSRS